MTTRPSKSLFAAFALVACAPTLPKDPVQRALVTDLARVVESRDQIGWTLDDIDVERVLPDAMESACQVDERTRTAALIWLANEIVRLGGPVEKAWVASGKDMGAIQHVLLMHRTRMLLHVADEWARNGKCPFWLEPDPEFNGIQNFDGKVIISGETGGRFYTQWEDGELGFGGGGAVRILGGYGFGDDLAVFAGAEFGGAGRFTDIQFGERVEVPAFLLIGATPVIFRFFDLSTYYELEVAGIGYVNQLRGVTQLGARVGGGIGFMRVQLGGILPGITASVNYDFIPGTQGEPTVHQIGAGLRGVFAVAF